MWQASTNSISSVLALTALATINPVSDSSIQLLIESNYRNAQSTELCEAVKTGSPIVYYGSSGQFFPSQNFSNLIQISSLKMQFRHKMIEQSFLKNGKNFPKEKFSYFSVLSNEVCKLRFKDVVSLYNEYDESIDIILWLNSGLTLSLSQFITKSVDSPVVFSLHRGTSLLVSDEQPIDEIVESINSVNLNNTDKNVL